MKKLYLLLPVILIAVFLLFFKAMYKNFDIRIELRYKNINAYNIDKLFAKKIKDEFLLIDEIKELYIFSKNERCTIYCKIKPFILNKKEIINEINRYLNNIIFNNSNIEIYFDDKYDLNYDAFLVISSDILKNKTLKNYSDEIYNKILDKKLASKAIILSEPIRTTYLFYKDSDLINYNLTVSDIKNILNKGNILQNSTIKTIEPYFYNLNIESDIKSADDIKNLALYFQDKDFSIKFKDVFDIKDDVKYPFDSLILFNSKNALVLAISKRKGMLGLIFNYRLNKLINSIKKEYPKYLNLKILNTKSLSKIKIIQNDKATVENSINLASNLEKEFIKENIKETLFLIGVDCPKISNKEDFFEYDKNKIVILSNKFNIKKIKNILKNNKIDYLNNKKIELEDENLDYLYKKIENSNYKYNETTKKTPSIVYKIDEYSINDYYISKKDITDNLFALNDGLFCTNYFDNHSNKVEIILKNAEKNKNTNIYLKKRKNFISLESLVKNKFENQYSTIVRKNAKFWARLYK